MRESILLVAVSLLATPSSPADPKHKQPLDRHGRGKFVAFAYTSNNLTAEGKPPVAGITIAADPEVLPLGSRVRISGASQWSGVYRVGDKGGKIKGRKVDIFVRSREEALAFGKRQVEIVLLGPDPTEVASNTRSGLRRSESSYRYQFRTAAYRGDHRRL